MKTCKDIFKYKKQQCYYCLDGSGTMVNFSYKVRYQCLLNFYRDMFLIPEELHTFLEVDVSTWDYTIWFYKALELHPNTGWAEKFAKIKLLK